MSWNGLKKNLNSLTHSQRKALIEHDHPQISIKRQAELLGISRSSIYYQPRVNERDIKIMHLIDKIYTDYPFYGSRRIKKELRIEYKIKICREKTQRLMRLMGLEAIYPKEKRTSFADKQHKVYPYLLRGVSILRPNQVWSTDITYVRLEREWCYLIVIMDWYSRYIISWRLSPNLEIDFCLNALREALSKSMPEIFNSDQDARFTSPQFTGVLEKAQVKISMDSKGRYLDNIFNERLWRTVKYENIYLQHYENIRQAESGLRKYFNFYNNKRFHSSLNDLTPTQVYHQNQNLISVPAVSIPCLNLEPVPEQVVSVS